MKNRNPFRYGVVVDNDAFCNRKTEIAYLKNQISNGYSIWLFSPRRFGKTSLVKKVFRESEDTICIFFDLYNIRSLDDFARKYANILANNLFSWKEDIKSLTKKLSEKFSNLSPSVSFDEFGSPSFNFNIQNIETHVDVEKILELPEKIAQEKGKRICIAFDEFQEINRIEPFLINWMRSSFQNQKLVSYLFLGSKQSLMQDIFTSNRSPFYEFATKMDLLPIGKEELAQFIQLGFTNNNMYIKDKCIDMILDLSECQPHFSQYFASIAFDLTEKGIEQNTEDFHFNLRERIINPQKDIFQDIYDQLTNSQRQVLYTIARIEGEGIYANSTRKKYDLPVSSSINIILKSLLKQGIIYHVENKYFVTNPIMKMWLKELN